MADEVAAEVRGIVHRYDGTEPALQGVDLAVEAGALCALIGANGSGKTTLLRILAGILEPSSGTVRMFGAPENASGPDPRKRVGYVSQDPALDPEMTVGETLNLLAALHGVRRPERAQRVEDRATAFGLDRRLERRIEALSGGQRRRLHLAAGMIHDPELLCLDEPAAGLDPEGDASLWAELRRRAARGQTTLIVSHDLAAVEEHATTVAILDRGKLIAAGPPHELARSSLVETYRQLTGRSVAALKPARKSRPGGRGRRRR